MKTGAAALPLRLSLLVQQFRHHHHIAQLTVAQGGLPHHSFTLKPSRS